MIQTTGQKLIVIIIIVALLGAFGYYVFSSSEATTVPTELSEQDLAGQDILALAYKFETVTFDESIFASPIFLSLVDFQIPLSPEAQGRNNPFAVIGAEGGVSPSGSKTVKAQ